MKSSMLVKALLVWCLIVPLAILNGTFRLYALVPLFGETLAQPLSGVLLALLIVGMAWLFLPWIGLQHTRQHVLIGAGWLLLTIVFEFGFGRFVAGKNWGELLQAYDLTTGNLWSAVLVVTALAPWLAARLRRH